MAMSTGYPLHNQVHHLTHYFHLLLIIVSWNGLIRHSSVMQSCNMLQSEVVDTLDERGQKFMSYNSVR